MKSCDLGRTLLPSSEDNLEIERRDALSLARAFGPEITWGQVFERRVAVIPPAEPDLPLR